VALTNSMASLPAYYGSGENKNNPWESLSSRGIAAIKVKILIIQ